MVPEPKPVACETVETLRGSAEGMNRVAASCVFYKNGCFLFLPQYSAVELHQSG